MNILFFQYLIISIYFIRIDYLYYKYIIKANKEDLSLKNY